MTQTKMYIVSALECSLVDKCVIRMVTCIYLATVFQSVN